MRSFHDLPPPIFRGAAIRRLAELIWSSANLRVTCVPCRHCGVIDGARLYDWGMRRRRSDLTEVIYPHLVCSGCGARRIVTRATLELAQDKLPEPDRSREWWSAEALMNRRGSSACPPRG